MPALKIIRYGAWAAVGLVGFVAAAIALGWWQMDGPGRTRQVVSREIAGVPRVGGPFSLVDHRGRQVTEKDFLGKPSLVFFGFTHCPDVCPTTLFDLTKRMKALGTEADKLNVLFITGDPERDTPEQMALYLQSFDPRIVGLSGTSEQVAGVLQAFKAVARKVPRADGGYTIDHTASVFMMDGDGRFAGMIDYHEAEDGALRKMKRLLTKGR